MRELHKFDLLDLKKGISKITFWRNSKEFICIKNNF